MKLRNLRIENLRVFSDVTIPFDNYTCLIGANGAGKSTVLCALNILFREPTLSATESTRPQKEDFHGKDTSKPIRITATFDNLSKEALDDFKDYARQGILVLTAEAVFDEASQLAQVKQFGQRSGMEEFRQFFENEKRGDKVADLQALYSTYVSKYPGLSKATTKQAMRDGLIKFESENPGLCKLIPSEDEFYGFSKGTNRLRKYLQWVFVPAVKDALSEQHASKNSALSQLLDRTVKARTGIQEGLDTIRIEALAKYKQVIKDNQDALSGLSAELATKIKEWSHPDASLKVEWQEAQSQISVPDPLATVTAKEGSFEGQLGRFGHGLQRSYLFALLHVLSKADDSTSPTLLLGCEEPELYQHPPQLRYLLTVFRNLSERNSQIILCTHSPLFVSGAQFEDVRLVKKSTPAGASKVLAVTASDVSAKINEAYAGFRNPELPEATTLKLHQLLRPEVNEMFFSPAVILVEGPEDVAYLSTYLQLSSKIDEFRRLGGHIIPCGGKSSMDRILAVANAIGIRHVSMIDADGDLVQAKPKTKDEHLQINTVLSRLADIDSPEPFPPNLVCEKRIAIWPNNIGDAVLGELKCEDTDKIVQKCHKQHGFAKDINKATLFIGDVLSETWQKNIKSKSLEAVCDFMLNGLRNA